MRICSVYLGYYARIYTPISGLRLNPRTASAVFRDTWELVLFSKQFISVALEKVFYLL